MFSTSSRVYQHKPLAKPLAYDPLLGPDIFSGVERPYISSDLTPIPDTGRPIPLNVALTNLSPLRVKPTHGNLICELQIRSYAVEAVEHFGDFASRAAYFLNMPAKGPFPLPKRTERWTVIKSPFVHAKSKENYERITYKRGIQILDSNLETVELWLAFLRKYARPGVGIKAQLYANMKLKDHANNSVKQITSNAHDKNQLE